MPSGAVRAVSCATDSNAPIFARMAQLHSESFDPTTCPTCSSRNTRLSTRPPGAEGPGFQRQCADCHHSWVVTGRSAEAPRDPLARPLIPGRLELASLAEFAAVLTVCSGVAIGVAPETVGWKISTEWQSETLGTVLARLEKVLTFRVIDGETVELSPIQE